MKIPTLASTLLATSLAGCALSAPEETGREASAILSGADDTSHAGVVAIENPVESCSGFVIAPDLVLTARHCVGPLVNETSPCVATNGGTIVTPGAPYAPSTIQVYVNQNLLKDPGAAHAVAEVILPADVVGLCGNDVALLRLGEALDPSVAIGLRLDGPPVAGEPVTAVGYGLSMPGVDATGGVRRSVDGVTVSKLGPVLPRYVDGEWTISQGPCAGDSGSPALDAGGVAIGVMSRGSKATCVDMIYQRVDSHAAWLRDAARASYQRSGVAVPPWIDPSVGGGGAGGGGGTGAGGGHATTPSDTGGCAVGDARRDLGGAWVLALAAIGVAARRRR